MYSPIVGLKHVKNWEGVFVFRLQTQLHGEIFFLIDSKIIYKKIKILKKYEKRDIIRHSKYYC